MGTVAGVYEIRNTVNGKRYIGSSADVHTRMRKHLCMLRNFSHPNHHLQNAWTKYGENQFDFKALLYCDGDNSRLYEQILLDNLKPEYNIAVNANNPSIGIVFSEERRRRMSETTKGLMTPEMRSRISASLSGRTQPEQAVKKRIQSMSGKKHSDSHKEKLSQSLMGHSFTDEVREKMSGAQKKRHAREREAGITSTEEYKQKHSNAAKARWAKKRGAS